MYLARFRVARAAMLITTVTLAACGRPTSPTVDAVMVPPLPPGAEAGPTTSLCHLSSPVGNASITSPFGTRWRRPHTGVDFGAELNAPVAAVCPGTVVAAGWRRDYGRTIDIRHPDGMVTRYAHLAAIAADLRAGAAVDAGQRIGDVGTSGNVTGPNLHFEVWLAGHPTDPAPLLSEGPDPRPMSGHLLSPPWS